ncbi:Kelch-type beta propeller,Galactose oxidase/kelch, beta-propeller,Kelch repeat type 1 [Cinara cedri]|uniref:Kelch domain-containing protein 10 n=1 Tax=Cinara cedri TaxID=506608 RepID=A0A5E4LYL4_9HEMI|nr:Kelch-type beta propeller,Galactose oxidase/kelch, beta-propeller,Kelch repeat type 1 [Cinara cedri]
MTNTSFPMYKFKPFKFNVLKQNHDPFEMPLSKIGHHLLCNDAYLITYVGINPIAATGRLWQYYFDLDEWKIIPTQNILPKVGSSLVTLFGNVIIIISCSKSQHCGEWSFRLCLGDLAYQYEIGQIRFKELILSGAIQIPNHVLGQGFVINGTDIFSIHGTQNKKHEMGVFQLDVITRKWEVLHPASHEQMENGKCIYPREVIFYDGRIYVFASRLGGIKVYCKFSKIHMFDLATRLWYLFKVKQDSEVRKSGIPNCYSYSCVQCPINRNLVYLCGGFKGLRASDAIWRFDLNTLQWEKLIKFSLPQPVYMHSTIITPSGRMYCYGGKITRRSPYYTNYSSNNLICAWITIPKLKILSWEAMVHYFKDQMFESSTETLKKIGIPPEFYNRIIEARSHINNV